MTAADYISDLDNMTGIFAGLFGCAVDELNDEVQDDERGEQK